MRYLLVFSWCVTAAVCILPSVSMAQSSTEHFCIAIIDGGSGLYGITASSSVASGKQELEYDKRAKKALMAAGAESSAIVQCISQSRSTTLAYYDKNHTPYREVSMSLASAPPMLRATTCDMTALCTVAWVFARRTYPDENIQCGIEARRGTSQNVSRAFVMTDARDYDSEVAERERRDPTGLKYLAADMRNRANLIKSACIRSAAAASSQNSDGPRINTP
jgi:hypothetical protein